tara:strand:- start:9038 stop:9271 length:234 start_codon:yes stop_codon:yes gene_type:complete
MNIPNDYYAFAALYKRLFFQWMGSNRNVSLTKKSEVVTTLKEMTRLHPYWVEMADNEIVDDLRLHNDMNAFNIKDVT